MGSPAPSSLYPSNLSRRVVEGASVFGDAGRGAGGVDFEAAGRGPGLAADFDGLSMLMTQSPIACGAFVKRLAWGVSVEAGVKVLGVGFRGLAFQGRDTGPVLIQSRTRRASAVQRSGVAS
ncbi:hypothetical protein SAMN05443572_1011478 [Myxococcus fulvus]|uniref:Uncharacterized protein n=1 Tax=Myxococcus fulvus TaxID=33 RepID=A0A511SUZ8_MYXFU|nr:hypothetical protein MFUL124B02_08275 [Myxococcus fulvus 124B02]GEN04978.1 hypothetical protein MFU01_00150 [Myxococcus fulvus]SET21869.1 hypothetical protein SAMN05443572_1011478 [Myxococcus fulvus]